MIKPGDLVTLSYRKWPSEYHEHGIGIVLARFPWDNKEVHVMWSGINPIHKVTAEHISDIDVTLVAANAERHDDVQTG